MQIRNMTSEDIEQVSRIEAESFSVPWSMESFMIPLRNSAYRAYVVEDNQQVIAYACTMCIIDEVELLNIAVDKQSRRKGYAAALINRMLQEGSRNQVHHYMLEVRESNTPARKLYESFGFEVTGVRKNYYSEPAEDAMLMDLFVNE